MFYIEILWGNVLSSPQKCRETTYHKQCFVGMLLSACSRLFLQLTCYINYLLTYLLNIGSDWHQITLIT